MVLPGVSTRVAVGFYGVNIRHGVCTDTSTKHILSRKVVLLALTGGAEDAQELGGIRNKRGNGVSQPWSEKTAIYTYRRENTGPSRVGGHS